MWSGIAGITVSVFAIIIIFLTRKNILDILDKDVILFDKNFELKNKAIQKAFQLVDEIAINDNVLQSTEFNSRAKDCYNELLCVVTDVRVADEFYNIAVDNTIATNDAMIAQFKLACRQDIGLKTKKAMTVKRLDRPVTPNYETSNLSQVIPANPVINTPVMPQPTTPVRPNPTANPTPVRPRPTPAPQSNAPTRPKPINTPTVKRPTKPSDEDDKI